MFSALFPGEECHNPVLSSSASKPLKRLTEISLSFNQLVGSAEGAGFNSHGRQAVACEPQDELEARRADIYSLRINAAPSALPINVSSDPRPHGRGY